VILVSGVCVCEDVERAADSAEAANDDYARSNRRVATETRNNSVEQTKYSAALNRVKSAAKSNAAAIGAMAASLATVGASMKTISVAREFDKINASLVTMTGSQEAADKAFKRIQNFATTTPYDLAQVATAFTKLTALGLNPSQEALESYGNTAAAMGKDLNQMIEAVADAATGEFERLKEFGIKARSEGDNVSLTFQGVSTTIGKNAAEIEAYLMGLGQVQFAGAMAERAATLDGAISNLGDSFDNLFLTISQAGAGSVFEDLARSSTEFLNNLGVMIRLSNGTASATEQLRRLRKNWHC
jgi:phage tail tape-measure protein